MTDSITVKVFLKSLQKDLAQFRNYVVHTPIRNYADYDLIMARIEANQEMVEKLL